MTNQTHRVTESDKPRIPCSGGRWGNPDCANQADICEHVEWNTGNTTGISFFYYCDDCHQAQLNGRAN